MGYQNISAADFKKALKKDDDFIVLDVRTNFEFERGHINDDILIPHNELIERYPELNAPKDKKIYIILRQSEESDGYGNIQ